MYMLTHISLTPGTLLFFAGVVLTAGSLVAAAVTAATAGSRKQKMSQRMKEKY